MFSGQLNDRKTNVFCNVFHYHGNVLLQLTCCGCLCKKFVPPIDHESQHSVSVAFESAKKANVWKDNVKSKRLSQTIVVSTFVYWSLAI